ncbi:hypothetical protein HDV57DRAFT_51328 [Trichoderma longibrachiatum]|uniref:Uncharacterized protein n=1 Tax=Trichoderma longibrachiatum ATCC 18648 TaxID=983965 RepID=A0A2T4C0C2_TRILO|nr:hypothetical protein M440DRAFT_335082 [Trichoderma longibrachiatum ATCC 18648]
MYSSRPEPSLTTATSSISAISPSRHDTKDALDTRERSRPFVSISGVVHDTVQYTLRSIPDAQVSLSNDWLLVGSINPLPSLAPGPSRARPPVFSANLSCQGLLAQACQTNAILYDELHAISPCQLPLPQSARDKATRDNLAAIRIPPPRPPDIDTHSSRS